MFNIFHWISLLAWLFIKDIYLIKDKINNVLYNQANYKKSFLYIMKESYIWLLTINVVCDKLSFVNSSFLRNTREKYKRSFVKNSVSFVRKSLCAIVLTCG
jgi:hypothetical protein